MPAALHAAIDHCDSRACLFQRRGDRPPRAATTDDSRPLLFDLNGALVECYDDTGWVSCIGLPDAVVPDEKIGRAGPLNHMADRPGFRNGGLFMRRGDG